MYFPHCTKKPRALQEFSWESDSFFLGRPLEIIVYFSFSSRNTRLIKKILVFVLNHVIEKKFSFLSRKIWRNILWSPKASQPLPGWWRWSELQRNAITCISLNKNISVMTLEDGPYIWRKKEFSSNFGAKDAGRISLAFLAQLFSCKPDLFQHFFCFLSWL